MEQVVDLLLAAGGVLLYVRQTVSDRRRVADRERLDRLYRRAKKALSRHVRSRLH